MDERILKTLLMKATGYTRDEITEEYAVRENGAEELVKRKVTSKYYPPDNAALKDYIALSGEKSAAELTDEELQKEKKRLLDELKQMQKNEADARRAKRKKQEVI